MTSMLDTDTGGMALRHHSRFATSLVAVALTGAWP